MRSPRFPATPDSAHPADATAEAVSEALEAATRTTVVLDTCVLVADPESIFAFGHCDIVLPLTVIEELDGLKGRDGDVGRSARAAVRNLEELRVANGGDMRSAVALPGAGTLRIELNGLRHDLLAAHGLDAAKADNRILAAALGLRQASEEAGVGRVKLVSADAALRIKASHLGLEAQDYQRIRSGTHTVANPGWHLLEVSSGLIDQLYGQDSVRLSALSEFEVAAFDGMVANEGAALRCGSQSVLARMVGVGDDRRLVRLDSHIEAWGLQPRSKEQRFALDLLLDPAVPMVGLSGHAGTGKTILALAAGLQQVFEPGSARYDRMMILRPVVAVGRQELGFLPGTVEEKLGPWMEAIVDAMVALGDDVSHRAAQDMLATWVRDQKLTMEAVTYMRGRSLQNTFILVDEAQNLEASVLKTLLTRVGEGSKCVLVGDTTQIDSPYLSERNNALAVLADTFAGEELFGHLVLSQGERSAVADLAASKL